MATMSIATASAVNTLLNWITGRENAGGEVPSRDDALRAAQELARHADKALGAGWRPDELPAAWPEDRRG